MIDDVITIMKKNFKSKTAKFEKFHIEKVGYCNYPTKEEIKQKAEPLPGILKVHSIFITKAGQLKGLELTCLSCTVEERCVACEAK